jgi:hemerythrin
MSILQWDGSLAIGNEKIDAQHKNLFELINNFHAACTAGGEQLDFKPTLMALYKYTTFHFSEEEALMNKTKYAFRKEHLQEHENFIRKLDELSGRARIDDSDICAEICTWLVGWLFQHISNTDKQLAACLLQDESSM